MFDFLFFSRNLKCSFLDLKKVKKIKIVYEKYVDGRKEVEGNFFIVFFEWFLFLRGLHCER
jgi:hypothetical protein